MSRATIERYVNPRKFRREQERLGRIAALRERDGDNCRRCRRPMSFDLPSGHDLGPKLVEIADGAMDALGNLCLTHVCCNAHGADNTAEVTERARRKNEAELLSRRRKTA